MLSEKNEIVRKKVVREHIACIAQDAQFKDTIVTQSALSWLKEISSQDKGTKHTFLMSFKQILSKGQVMTNKVSCGRKHCFLNNSPPHDNTTCTVPATFCKAKMLKGLVKDFISLQVSYRT